MPGNRTSGHAHTWWACYHAPVDHAQRQSPPHNQRLGRGVYLPNGARHHAHTLGACSHAPRDPAHQPTPPHNQRWRRGGPCSVAKQPHRVARPHLPRLLTRPSGTRPPSGAPAGATWAKLRPREVRPKYLEYLQSCSWAPGGPRYISPKFGPGGDSGPIIVNTLSILGELPAAVTSPRWPPRGPHLVGVFHWGVSTGVASVGVPRGTVAWQQNTAGLAAIFDCAGASVGGRGGGTRPIFGGPV